MRAKLKRRVCKKLKSTMCYKHAYPIVGKCYWGVFVEEKGPLITCPACVQNHYCSKWTRIL